MRDDFQLILNATAKGLELERQATGSAIGMEMPGLPINGLPPFAVRSIVTIDNRGYEVTIRRRRPGYGVSPNV